MQTDNLDLIIAKRLLDYLKSQGFKFHRAAPGEDGPLVRHRIGDDCVDLIHLDGFSRDCFAWRKRTSSLIVPGGGWIQRQENGSTLNVLNEVLTWETRA